MLDFDQRYTVDGWRGVAFYLVGYVQEPDEDTHWSGVYNEDTSRVVAVMVGDDRRHIVDVDDLTPLADGDYCTECGQIGCRGDSLRRDVADIGFCEPVMIEPVRHPILGVLMTDIRREAMTKEDVIERYCMLSGRVAREVFGFSYAADCFCERGGLPDDWDWRYEEPVIAYIERIVLASLPQGLDIQPEVIHHLGIRNPYTKRRF